MKRVDIRMLTLSFIVFNILFFSFVHGVFRLQLFKHSVNGEFLEKLQVETLRMAEEYQDIEAESEMTRKRILDGNLAKSQLIAEQVAGLINDTLKQEKDTVSQDILSKLSAYAANPETCFWIFDDSGAQIFSPRSNLTDVVVEDGRVFTEAVRIHSLGTLFLSDQSRGFENPGFGKRVDSLGWTVVSFQPWEATARKIRGVEALERIRIDRLISQAGKNGSAGVVNGENRIQEYTYAQLKDKPVNDIKLEGARSASELLFNRQDGFREYVLVDPVSKHGKYRQAYMAYDEDTQMTYFITQDKRGLFTGVNQRSAPILYSLGFLSLGMLAVNAAYVVRNILKGKETEEF